MGTDHRQERHTRASDSVAAETKVAHLVLKVGIKGNVDGECNERQNGGKEGDQGSEKRDGDVLREREEQGNKGNTTCYKSDPEPRVRGQEAGSRMNGRRTNGVNSKTESP